ncbi:MAG: deoxyribodipyrimidine photolyase [Acidimicrobiia bacterium]|nr:deoxyribodipyrimidine photolyase [Acidimicrobiia bacterium]
MIASSVPPERIRTLVEAPPDAGADYVLYWMTAYRRTRSNFAFQRAVEWARSLSIPLVVLSALEVDYRWASARHHTFMIEGMADVGRALANTPVLYYPFVEAAPGAGRGLLDELAARAAVVVADDAPVFFLPAVLAAAGKRLRTRLEAVDHNGLLPLAATDRVFLRAYDLRRFLQRELPRHLDETPDDLSLDDLRPVPDGLLDDVTGRWPTSHEPASTLVPDLPIDHAVAPVHTRGGLERAGAVLERFVAGRLDRYDERNHPDARAESGLSPYLHFGHVSSHQVFSAVVDHEDWNPGDLSDSASGARQGWWGMSPQAESFLDQVITWRELGYRTAMADPGGYDRYEALPDWARRTLADHAGDAREYVYSLDEFAAAATHDEIWNAAQRQLLTDGIIHNYLRMLWGKKILEWTPSPQVAHDIMIELNNRYAIDGRDPNSITGIHWVLGRFDRPWAPERPVFGMVRFMSSDSTRRKLRLTEYLAGVPTLLDE